MGPFGVGILLVLLFNLFAGINSVFLGSILQGVNPLTFVFYNAVFTTIYFTIHEYKKGGGIGFHIKEQGLDLANLSIFSAISWLSVLYCYQNIEPAIGGAMSGALMPITILALQKLFKKYASPKPMQLLSAIGVIGSIAYLVQNTLLKEADATGFDKNRLLVGALFATIAGVSLGINNYCTENLLRKDMSPAKIMALRFYPLIIATGFLMPSGSFEWIMHSKNIGTMLFAATVGSIFPMLAILHGMKRVGAFVTTMLTALVPVFTLLFQAFDKRLKFSTNSLVPILLLTIFSLLGVTRGCEPKLNEVTVQEEQMLPTQQPEHEALSLAKITEIQNERLKKNSSQHGKLNRAKHKIIERLKNFRRNNRLQAKEPKSENKKEHQIPNFYTSFSSRKNPALASNSTPEDALNGSDLSDAQDSDRYVEEDPSEIDEQILPDDFGDEDCNGLAQRAS
ncbi:MAG: DMT family transporter [Bacteriovoracia bacterium]